MKIHRLYEGDLNDTCQLDTREEERSATVTLQDLEPADHITFSPDISHLASRTATEMKLWDTRSGTPVKTFKGENVVLAEDISVIAWLQDTTLVLRDVASNSLIARFESSTTVVGLALSFDGLRVAAALSDGTVSLWGWGTRKCIASFGGYFRGLQFSPSGYALAYLSDHGGIQLSNGFNGKFIANLQYDSGRHVKFMFSRNGSRLASLAWTGPVDSLTLWNGENGEFISIAKDVEFWQLAISGDGFLIATGGWSRKVQLWSRR